MSALPIVALVGRPNVGKSTLFNRLIGRPQAIVEDEPGTTRDRNYGQTTWNDKTFLVVDTGGLDFGNEADIPRAIRQQADMAIEEADVIVFMVDARSGLTALDHEVADQLRLRGRPVVLAANKAESESRRLDSSEFYALGLGDPIPISALNGIDTGDLLDAVAELLPRAEEEDEADDVPRITLVGRPNVGKSSLLNALLQQDRALVSPTPGTTRDSTDTELIHDGRPVILVDTAGIRKRGHIDRGVEHYSVLRAMRAITRSDVAVLVIDATEPLAAQDAHIAGYAWDAAKGLVIVVNKWDLVVPKDDHTMDQYARRLRQELHFVHDAPMVFTSALTRQRVRKILDLALQVRDERLKRVPTGQLNAVIQEALKRHQPVSKSGRLLKLRYVTQARTNPPTFVLFVNDPQLVHFSYRRFLENQIREHFGFSGTAIRLYFRSSREAPASPQDRKLLRAGRSQRVPALGADRGIVGASELDQASATARDSASTHDSAGVRAGDGESRRQPATRRSRERQSPGRDTRERSPVRRPRAEAKRSPEGTSPPVRRPARKSGSSSRL